MAGISDSPWRQICKNWGADVVYSEFVSVDALFYKSKKSLELLQYKASEQPLIVQIFGKRAELYEPAAKIVEQLGVAGIDINFGCPAKKVAGHGGGICLLRDLDNVKKIIENTSKAIKIPLSVKTRIGLNAVKAQPEKGQISVLNFIEAIKDYPISAMIVHGRTYETPFSGPVDIEALKNAKNEFKKYWPQGIFLINGSFQTIESVVRDLKYTEADGIALSRSLYGQPWLFKQIKDYLKTGSYQEISKEEIIDTAIEHSQLLWECKGESGFKEMRKHLLFYVKGHPQASELRRELVAVENPKDVEKIMRNI